MSTSISTTIDIDATPQAVWEVLTDFAAYDEWNPFMRIEGTPAIGAELVVRLTPQDGSGTTFKPVVTNVVPGSELRWYGKLVIRRLFSGEHSFVLTTNVDRTTRLTHREHFSGILVFFMKGMLRSTRTGFEAFNEALRQRVETVSTRR